MNSRLRCIVAPVTALRFLKNSRLRCIVAPVTALRFLENSHLRLTPSALAPSTLRD